MTTSTDAPIKPAVPKPLGMLIMQIVLTPVFIVCFFNMFAMPLGLGFGPELSWLLTFMVPALLSAATMLAIALAKPVARWLGGAVIALTAFVCIYALLTWTRVQPGSDIFQPGWLLATVFLLVLQPWWLFCIAFSRKARRYLGLISN